MTPGLDRRAALTALAAAIAAPTATAAAPAKDKPWASADAAAKLIVDGRFSPGVSILARQRGKTIYDGSTGLADIETATPMTTRSVCRIGSITKQFTATAILLLAQDGKLSLNDNLSVYLPQFPGADKLPMRRILSHTAGLGNYTEMNPPTEIFRQFRQDRTPSELVAWMADSKPLQISPPGTAWRYSNTGYVLLGAVIETVAGKPYGEVLAERIFKPLGLADTAYDHNADVVPRRAAGYTPNAKAAGGFDNAAFIAMTTPGRAGALRSTVSDLCAWHEALFAGKVLKPEMLAEMLTPAVLNDGKLPEGPGPGGVKRPIKYGYGVMIGEADGQRVVSHGGGIPGFASFLATLPDAGLTYAIIRNSDGGPPANAPPAVTHAPDDLIAAIHRVALAH